MVDDQRAMYEDFVIKVHSLPNGFKSPRISWMTVTKWSVCVIGVGIEGCCWSMRYLVTLLSKDLCQTTWCGTGMERCRHPQPMSLKKWWWGPDGWHDSRHWYGVWPRVWRSAWTIGGAKFLEASWHLRWKFLQLPESMLQQYREINYWSHPNEAQNVERLVVMKEDCCRSWCELQEDWCVQEEPHVVPEGAQGWCRIYALQ
jgi:hypothetical protein